MLLALWPALTTSTPVSVIIDTQATVNTLQGSIVDTRSVVSTSLQTAFDTRAAISSVYDRVFDTRAIISGVDDIVAAPMGMGWDNKTQRLWADDNVAIELVMRAAVSVFSAQRIKA